MLYVDLCLLEKKKESLKELKFTVDLDGKLNYHIQLETLIIYSTISLLLAVA